MNGLKKLFSPSALAATLASAMLLSSAIVAFAETSACTATNPISCPTGYTLCTGFGCHHIQYWWCCPPSNSACDVVGQNCTGTVYGFCKPGP
jgi:hypothetical protein